MKHLKPNKKWLLVIIELSLVVFILIRAVLFFTAKPKITVDYVAEYNRTSMPENYKPEDNAVLYYQKSSNAFVNRPNELRISDSIWSADLYDTDRTLLEGWILANSKALEYFRIGANKPYWWTESSTKGNLGKIIDALFWDAKVKATKEEFKPAFEDILTYYKAGKHKCRPNLLVSEQERGLDIKQDALETAFIILDRKKAPNEDLKFLQDTLQKEIDNVPYIPSLQTEKFLIYDNLQRTLINNGRGTGRLAWSVSKNLYLYLDDLRWDKSRFDPIWDLLGRLFFCLMGPTWSDMEKEILVNNQIDKMMAKTPWQVQQEWDDYTKEIKKIWHTNTSIGMRLICLIGRISSNDCMTFFGSWSLFHLYYETKAQTDALITVLAILRFKNDYNRLPETLEEVVSEGYLKSLSNDPFSDGPLVYKLTDNNFLLYSVGKDFIDNGGAPRPGGSMAFTKGITYDIIYWPVKVLDKSQYGEHIRQSFEAARNSGPLPISRGE